VRAHRELFPEICVVEFEGAFDLLAVLDGIAETISQADINAWFAQVQLFAGGAGK